VDSFSSGFMNFMYRDNGLTGATRRSIENQSKVLQMQLFKEFSAVNEVEMAEKREILRRYEHKYQGKQSLINQFDPPIFSDLQ
jgi:hypothetical protein